MSIKENEMKLYCGYIFCHSLVFFLNQLFPKHAETYHSYEINFGLI